jgi:2-phospho-L-lactate transferase/gluconeogenesis factor (CofD/UPF0052 family)
MGCGFLDTILVNNESIPPEVELRYKEELARPVQFDLDRIKELGVEVLQEEIATLENNVIRHDTKKVAEILYSLIINETKNRYNA